MSNIKTVVYRWINNNCYFNSTVNLIGWAMSNNWTVKNNNDVYDTMLCNFVNELIYKSNNYYYAQTYFDYIDAIVERTRKRRNEFKSTAAAILYFKDHFENPDFEFIMSDLSHGLKFNKQYVIIWEFDTELSGDMYYPLLNTFFNNQSFTSNGNKYIITGITINVSNVHYYTIVRNYVGNKPTFYKIDTSGNGVEGLKYLSNYEIQDLYEKLNNELRNLENHIVGHRVTTLLCEKI